MKIEMDESRAKRQWQKFDEEERHFQYLAAKGYTSVKIADTLIHNMFEIMKVGIKNQHPDFTEEQILDQLREIITEDKSFKREIRGKRNGGI